MGAVKNHYHDEICARDMRPFPRDHATDESYCPECGSPDPTPSVEVWEELEEIVCTECAGDVLARAAA